MVFGNVKTGLLPVRAYPSKL